MKVPFHFWISSAALTTRAFKRPSNEWPQVLPKFTYLPTYLCCCFFFPMILDEYLCTEVQNRLNNFKVFKDKHGVSFLQIRFVAWGLLCDILWLYYNMVNLLLLSYLSDGFHVNLCFTQHLCHNTLFLRRWSLWSCVLWFHMLTLFNCKSSLVRFIALVCYFGISHRWIVPICVKSVDLFLDVQCSFPFLY